MDELTPQPLLEDWARYAASPNDEDAEYFKRELGRAIAAHLNADGERVGDRDVAWRMRVAAGLLPTLIDRLQYEESSAHLRGEDARAALASRQRVEAKRTAWEAHYRGIIELLVRAIEEHQSATRLLPRQQDRDLWRVLDRQIQLPEA